MCGAHIRSPRPLSRPVCRSCRWQMHSSSISSMPLTYRIHTWQRNATWRVEQSHLESFLQLSATARTLTLCTSKMARTNNRQHMPPPVEYATTSCHSGAQQITPLPVNENLLSWIVTNLSTTAYRQWIQVATMWSARRWHRKNKPRARTQQEANT